MQTTSLLSICLWTACLYCVPVYAADERHRECTLDGSQREINDCAAERLNKVVISAHLQLTDTTPRFGCPWRPQRTQGA
jgi:hypothetical protein